MTKTAIAIKQMSLPSDQDATGRTLGDREIELVGEVLRSGTLTSTKGNFVKRLETGFAERLGARFAYACSVGEFRHPCGYLGYRSRTGR